MPLLLHDSEPSTHENMADAANANVGSDASIAITSTTVTPRPVYPVFDFAEYSTLSCPITVHYCTDLYAFAAAVECLRGEKYLGVDIEHEPIGGRSRKKNEAKQVSEAARQLKAESNLIARKTYNDFLAANPDCGAEFVKTRGGLATGFRMPDKTYYRFTRNAKTKVSVLQISSASDIVVAHISAFPCKNEVFDKTEFIPPALQDMFEDPTVIKMGVKISGAKNDMHNCARYLDLWSYGLLELYDLDALVRTKADGETDDIGLNRLCEIYLGRTLSGKGAGNITTSEWHLPQDLSDEQLDYAANDAFVAVKIFEAMMQKFDSMDPSPPFPSLLKQDEFDYEASQAELIAKCESKNTPAARRKLRRLGALEDPSPPPAVPEGMSASNFKNMKKLDAMTPTQRRLAEQLKKLRDDILEEEWEDPDPTLNYTVLHDNLINRLATTYPRPKTQTEMLGHLPSRPRRVLYEEDYAPRFFKVIVEHVAEFPEDAVAAVGVGAYQAIDAGGEVQVVSETDGRILPPEDKGTLVMVDVQECLEGLLEE